MKMKLDKPICSRCNDRKATKSYALTGSLHEDLDKYPYAHGVAVYAYGFKTKKAIIAAVRKALAAVAIALSLSGCGLLTHTDSARSQSCTEANSNYRIARAINIGCDVLAGGTAASGIITTTVADEPYADIILGASSVLFVGCSAIASFFGGEYAEETVMECRDTE